MTRFRMAVAAGVLSVVSFAPAAAHAQTAISGSEDVVVLPDTIERGDNGVGNNGVNNGGIGSGEQVLGETVTRGLAVTGTDALGLAVIGTVAVVAGGLALTARRRRTV